MRAPPVAAKPPGLLVLRLDAIGDYILFRDLLPVLRHAPRFRGHRLALVGNVAWRELAETLDREVVDEFIWVRPADLLRGRWDNLPLSGVRAGARAARCRACAGLLAALNAVRWDALLYPSAYPDAQVDALVAGLSARPRIGVGREGVGRTGLMDYEDQAVLPAAPRFVFDENVAIARQVTGVTCALRHPTVDRARLPVTTTAGAAGYAAVFIGGSHWTKRWPVARFAAVVRGLWQRHGLHSVLLGSAAERRSAARIVAQAASAHPRDLCGALSLTELWAHVADARLLVSNDSCAIHMAAAAGVPFVCITNGHTGRNTFWPYPAEAGVVQAICDAPLPACLGVGLAGRQLRDGLGLWRVRPADVLRASRYFAQAV